jgi:hypothetical protein
MMSPRVRGVLRRGVVYGLAGAFAAGDAVTSAAKNVGRGATATASQDGSAERTQQHPEMPPAG